MDRLDQLAASIQDAGGGFEDSVLAHWEAVAADHVIEVMTVHRALLSVDETIDSLHDAAERLHNGWGSQSPSEDFGRTLERCRTRLDDIRGHLAVLSRAVQFESLDEYLKDQIKEYLDANSGHSVADQLDDIQATLEALSEGMSDPAGDAVPDRDDELGNSVTTQINLRLREVKAALASQLPQKGTVAGLRKWVIVLTALKRLVGALKTMPVAADSDIARVLAPHGHELAQLLETISELSEVEDELEHIRPQVTQYLATLAKVATRLEVPRERPVSCFPGALTVRDRGWRPLGSGAATIYEIVAIPPNVRTLQLFAQDCIGRVIATTGARQSSSFLESQWVQFEIDVDPSDVHAVRIQGLP